MPMDKTGRRGFLKTVALAGGAASAGYGAQNAAGQDKPAADETPAGEAAAPPKPPFLYPRTFTGRQLAMLAFPLGGVCAGSISLGGRGQLRDWEIFNRSDKGRAPEYALPGIWVQAGEAKPVARVLEARIMPPYEGPSGLGSKNAPGLHRLRGATFTGEFPFARIAFRDSKLPVKVTLEAFSPFIPLDPEDSGLPVAVMRYRVRNPGKETARVAIAFAIDNPLSAGRGAADKRTNERRAGALLEGIVMSNPGLPEGNPQAGTFAISCLSAGGKVSSLRGWPKAKWWASPLLYWDDFTADGELGPEAPAINAAGSLCLKREIAPGAEADFTFLLSWHFPNRTPAWCGWTSDPGGENAIIGNYYCTRFADAWQAAEYAAEKLADLEARTRRFAAVMRESTLPAPVKDAAMANLSTLVTQTAFRTADGVFRGFEGVNDQRGCCHGSCTHVWNYETATQALFPTLARSMREAHFNLAERLNGCMPIRLNLPEGKQTGGFAATDGQMGQIIKACLDWQLSGDHEWLRKMWPKIKRTIEFCWIPDGWDANKDGVMEGVQHNTYDVEFFGPNPMCGIYYLGALRAGEEMARAAGDDAAAQEYRRLFSQGSQWIDANLFNGEFYIQKIRGVPKDRIPAMLRSDMGTDDTEHPDFQVAEGCLADQLMGQYVADTAGLGPLTDPEKIRKTLHSIYRYNFKRSLEDHESMQRIYALNDEAGLVVCDYGKTARPKVPFPYYAEVWTGLEYQAAALFLYAGMTAEGIEVVEASRRRFDGERRNPWDEPECGHHYARAMSAWSAVLALSGFRYRGAQKAVVAIPAIHRRNFRSFWSTATGWGAFTEIVENGRTRFSLDVIAGELPCRSVRLPSAAAGAGSVRLGQNTVEHESERQGREAVVTFAQDLTVRPGQRLLVTV